MEPAFLEQFHVCEVHLIFVNWEAICKSGSISQLLSRCSTPWLLWMQLNLWWYFARHFFFFFSLVGWDETGSTWHVSHYYHIAPTSEDRECGAFDEMSIGRGNKSTWGTSSPVPLCPQIPHGLNPSRHCGKPPELWHGAAPRNLLLPWRINLSGLFPFRID
jgi:hypothetical protein